MPAGPPELPPGTVFNERFRIIRTAGRGGMGIVYEAIDQKLNRRVALKCVEARFLSRLPSETRAAREVSHFNVCKVYDLHSCLTLDGEIEYLSMEFIDGETLLTRIRRDGTLPSSLALEIALQICSGLGQAHRQGIVHGDLKCSNIILAQEPGLGIRVVITDFGLARIQSDGGGEAPLGGTYGYMPPEQLLGASASAASDIYALGVLCHVMLTGKEPARPRLDLHAGDVPLVNPAQAETAPVKEAATRESTATISSNPSPEIVVEDWERNLKPLPAPWKKVVARCLAPRAADRFVSCDAVAKALRPRHLGRKVMLAAALFAALMAIIWQTRTAPPEEPIRLLVMPIAAASLDAGTGERGSDSTAGLSTEVADRLTGARKQFTVLSPREAERNQVDTLEKAKTILGATHVLEARIKPSGGGLAADAFLIDMQSGRRIGELHTIYIAGDSQALSRAVTAMVAEAFRFPDRSPAETVGRAAYSDYIRGIDLLRKDNLANADTAIPFLTKAIQLDPNSALPYAGRAEAELIKFFNGEGEEWLRRAEGDAARARAITPGKVPVLLVSGSARQARGQYELALQDFIQATQLGPADSETWRRLALCYERANRPQDAVATYQKAITAQPDYYRHYITFGSFFMTHGQFARAEEQYRHAVKIAPGLDSGHWNLGLALMQQGRFPDAEAELLGALKIRPSLGLLNNLGSLYYAQESFEEAKKYYERSLAMGPHTAVQCRNLGDTERHLGRSAQSQEAYAEARKLVEQNILLNPRLAGQHSLLGLIDAFLGEEKAARFELGQALGTEPENRSVMRDAAIAYEVMGDRDAALAALEKAPLPLLEELLRQPDLAKLRYDAHFLDLISRERARP